MSVPSSAVTVALIMLFCISNAGGCEIVSCIMVAHFGRCSTDFSTIAGGIVVGAECDTTSQDGPEADPGVARGNARSWWLIQAGDANAVPVAGRHVAAVATCATPGCADTEPSEANGVGNRFALVGEEYVTSGASGIIGSVRTVSDFDAGADNEPECASAVTFSRCKGSGSTLAGKAGGISVGGKGIGAADGADSELTSEMDATSTVGACAGAAKGHAGIAATIGADTEPPVAIGADTEPDIACGRVLAGCVDDCIALVDADGADGVTGSILTGAD
mmetsp:Transcript_84706/g.150014  ORF Transcript_84706/g.150014 Transcript_84706/m.150014 type:complete len:276 (+) Transcript_84706:2757-3584(+)